MLTVEWFFCVSISTSQRRNTTLTSPNELISSEASSRQAVNYTNRVLLLKWKGRKQCSHSSSNDTTSTYRIYWTATYFHFNENWSCSPTKHRELIFPTSWTSMYVLCLLLQYWMKILSILYRLLTPKITITKIFHIKIT